MQFKYHDRVVNLLGPFQGLFAALFFFGFGLEIEPGALGTVGLAAVLLSFAALASKLIGGWWIGARQDHSIAVRVNLGLTISPRGEFSILVATYGAAAGQAYLSSVGMTQLADDLVNAEARASYDRAAATLGESTGAPLSLLLGDLLVRLDSAMGSHSDELKELSIDPQNCGVIPV